MDDIGMIEMRVWGEERVFFGEFEVHIISFFYYCYVIRIICHHIRGADIRT